jgi:signal transduction histidine kinase
LAATVQDLDDTIKELRMAIFSLQARGHAPGGIRGQLLEVVTDAARTLGFDPRLQFDGPIETIADDVAGELVPTLREALSNVAQHARASACRVEVSAADGIVLRVTDDGVGVPDEVLGGRGLANMAQRAKALGGVCSVTAASDGGTELVWRVPTGR